MPDPKPIDDHEKAARHETGAEAALDTARLHLLAGACRVATSYQGHDGQQHGVSNETLVAVLAGLGHPVASDDDVDTALTGVDEAPWRRLLPPIVVVAQGRPQTFDAHVRYGAPIRAWVETEDGGRHALSQVETGVAPREIDEAMIGRARFAVPDDLPLGWHSLCAESEDSAERIDLVVTPARLTTADPLRSDRAWGYAAQLYSVRSSRSWGIGDFSDLGDLAAISGAEQGADYVLVNPLHAGEPSPPLEPSPYLPTSRRFFNPLYLRIEAIPEFAELDTAARDHIEVLAAGFAGANEDAERLDRDSTFAAKMEALEALHAVPLTPARRAQLAAFEAEHGEGLENFALWCALQEKLGDDAPEWTDEASRPGTRFVERQLGELADRVAFFAWIQFLCDEQLAAAQRTTVSAGMRIGVVHDLAVGVHLRGADAWALQDVLAQGVSVGAPPDMFNQQGQNWFQPPWQPEGLAEAGYRPYRDMLRTILRHAGGIRIDHILGLFRLWWVPAYKSSADGAYVYYDHDALIGILALEAQRAGAVVIGEDLGVFEPWVRDYLAERGILGTSILWFENTEHGPIAPEDYRPLCLASVNTHDLPPTLGYLAGEHVALRERLGLLTRPAADEWREDRAAQEVMLAELRHRGLLADDADDRATVEALYEFLALSPSAMFGVALVDAVGEKRTQNQPGTSTEYPNWQIPLAGPDGTVISLDDLATDPRALSLIESLGRAGLRTGSGRVEPN